ncbi:MAG TPA: PAS domain-containing protein [Sphingomicrobium sp.]
MTDRIEALVDSDGVLLAMVLDQTHDCIKLLSLDGVIQYVNRQGAIAMQLSSPSELIGQPYLRHWPEEVRPLLETALADARRGKLGRFHASRPRPDGSPSWWDVTISPVRASSGEITHFATIGRDTTNEVLERQRVEAISVEMRHRLKNALTVAGGIVMMSARGRPEVSEFAGEVLARFSQLAKVEALVLDPDTDKRLIQVVHALAGSYGENAALSFGEVPDVTLSHQVMQALALCFGELITNSMKYGALRDGRRVQIDGTAGDGFAAIIWQEETVFGAPRAGGQGLGLIERLIKTAGGTFQREVDDRQMRAIMTLPVT